MKDDDYIEVLFATDLDGTMITEQRKEDDLFLALETNHGKSYISRNNMKKLQKISEYADVVPITTRSMASFAKFNIGMPFKYALIENGGYLLVNGREDEKWTEESIRIMRNVGEKENECRDFLENHGYENKSGSRFVFDYINRGTSLKENMDVWEKLTYIMGDNFLVNLNGEHGIFVVYNGIDKGASLLRFLQRINYNVVITCGDSRADYGMLIPHISIGLDGSPAKYLFPKEKFNNNNQSFTSFALDKVLEIIIR